MKAKEAWQMTRDEFEKQRRLRQFCRRAIHRPVKPVGSVYAEMQQVAALPLLPAFHLDVVEAALAEGRCVPAYVLRDYPQLRAA